MAWALLFYAILCLYSCAQQSVARSCTLPSTDEHEIGAIIDPLTSDFSPCRSLLSGRCLLFSLYKAAPQLTINNDLYEQRLYSKQQDETDYTYCPRPIASGGWWCGFLIASVVGFQGTNRLGPCSNALFPSPSRSLPDLRLRLVFISLGLPTPRADSASFQSTRPRVLCAGHSKIIVHTFWPERG